MNGGKPVVNPLGFTILEVMVVLAVTLIILGSAIIAISGRTQTAIFMQQVNEVQSQLQAIMNNVSTGTFSTQPIYCNVNSGNFSFSLTPVTDTGDCIYLGDALLFTQSNQYFGFEIFGAREAISNSGNLSATYGDAQPTIPSTPPSMDELVTSTSLDNELVPTAMKYMTTAGQAFSASTNNTDMVAFMYDPIASGTTGNLSSNTSSGAVGVNIIPVEDSAKPTDHQITTPSGALGYASSVVNVSSSGSNQYPLASTAASLENPAGGVGICFQSQSTNQSVLYTLGGSGRNTSIENQVFSGANCS
jgi:type II secretory pathway pseudopilin PulG